MLPKPPLSTADQQEAPGPYDPLATLRDDLANGLHAEVSAMNLDNFIVRAEREHVTHYKQAESWVQIDEVSFIKLRDHVAGLPSEQAAEDITAKLFDLTCLNLQLALVNATSDFVTYRDRIIDLANDLETKDSIPAVKAELVLIQEIQNEEYWRDITLTMIEVLRRKMRGLIQFIDRKSIKPVYSAFTDEIGTPSEVTLTDFSTGINLAQYRRKVESYIRANENHIVIAKLKHNKPLTPTDLAELERFVFESEAVESRERFEKIFGADRPLTVFIRSLVGLDRNAAKEAFGQFLDSACYNSQQIRFVEMIIEKLTQSGVMDPGQLYEPPFTAICSTGLDGAFSDSDADAIVHVLSDINQKAA